MRNFVKYPLLKTLRNMVAEGSADRDSCLCLDDETRLRLISMSAEELRELAEITSVYPSEKAVELAYRGSRQTKLNITEHALNRLILTFSFGKII